MKSISQLTLLLLFILLRPGQSTANGKCPCDESDTRVLTGPYLGQEPPGSVPEIFAPGFVSTEMHEHSIPSFSPDGNELLWSSQFIHDGGKFPNKVIGSRIHNGEWSAPDFVESIPMSNSSSAFYAPDGNRIFFSSFSDGETGHGGFDIWYIEKDAGGWSSPRNLDTPINSSRLETYATFTRDLTIYFLGEIDPETHAYGIYRSELVNGTYQDPQLLPESINSQYLDWTPFISPDESYLLFSSNRPSGSEEGDLYISYRYPDGSWTDPVNLGPDINGPLTQERFPYVSPDGNYLFFVSNRTNEPRAATDDSEQDLWHFRRKLASPGNSWNDIYWVDAGIINQLRPPDLR